MAQTIDLRRKETPFEAPRPPVEEVVSIDEPVVIEQPEETPVEAGQLGWTHIVSPSHPQRLFYAAIILGIAAVVVAIFARDILFTSVLGLAALILLVDAYRVHYPHQIRVHATGVSINDEHHHFADMKSFWIEYQPYAKELSIELKKTYAPRIRIPLEDTNPLEIRQAMISYVPEKEHPTSLLDDIVRLIGI